jgi:hypothetical protein
VSKIAGGNQGSSSMGMVGNNGGVSGGNTAKIGMLAGGKSKKVQPGEASVGVDGGKSTKSGMSH